MDKAQIQTAIQDGPEAVQKLIESEADRRVNAAVETARKKWDTELPATIDAEIQRRTEQAEKDKQERLAISQEIDQHFEGTGIDPETWTDMLDIDGLLKLEGEERTARIEQVTGRIIGTVDRALKEKFRSKAPEGTPLDDGEGDSEAAFKSQLLENMR